jgi:hypothetical protein
MDDEQQQVEFLAALVALTEKYSAYGTPKVYSDGDIIIRLDPAMKKKLQRGNAIADTFSRMMKDDMKPSGRKGWIE